MVISFVPNEVKCNPYKVVGKATIRLLWHLPSGVGFCLC